MKVLNELLNWQLLKGSHDFPGPDGGTCINEAAVVAAGFSYRKIDNVHNMPSCFSRVIGQYTLTLNDGMPAIERQRLVSFVARLAGTADSPEVEMHRAEYLAMQAVTVFAARTLRLAGLEEHAEACRSAQTPAEGKLAASAAVRAARAARTARTGKAAAWATAAATAATMVSRAAEQAATAAWTEAGLAALAAAEAATMAEAWDDALTALDGVLAIGRRAAPLQADLVLARMEHAKAGAREREGAA